MRAEQALLHLAGDRLPQALAEVERIAADLAAGLSLENTEDTLRPQLICHRVWVAAGDAHAALAIEAAYAELQTRAAKVLDDELRHGVLEKIAMHREVAAAWRAQRQAHWIHAFSRDLL